MSLCVLFAGCGGYESNFSCKGYPDQATCESVSEAYEKRFAAGQKVTQYTKDQKDASHDTSGNSGPGQAPSPMVFSGKPDSAVGKPVITPASALRVTVFPWKDTKTRLHDQSRHYLTVDEADFIFGHMAQGVSTGSMAVAFFIGAGIPILLYEATATGFMMLATGLLLSVIFVSIAMFAAVKTRDKARGIGVTDIIMALLCIDIRRLAVVHIDPVCRLSFGKNDDHA